jgi:hypothetical protein
MKSSAEDPWLVAVFTCYRRPWKSGTEELTGNIKRLIVLIQILCFWTLSIVQSLSKNIVLLILQNTNVSETGFCLRLQVKPTQFHPIDRVSPYLRTPKPRWAI